MKREGERTRDNGYNKRRERGNKEKREERGAERG